ncbi:hypothetical protein [Hymenobacter tenuis]
MLIDFKEIPQANKPGGYQDSFELFSRDFIELLGYEIVSGPARGADGGIDFKVKENRKTQNGHVDFYWLASCKHYIHSDTAIGPSIEQNILDRTISNGCQGFMGIYSTLPTNGLINLLEGLTKQGYIEHKIFDYGKIENRIVGIALFEKLFIRYFPKSYKNWKELYYYIEPIKLFEMYLDSKLDASIKGVFLSAFKSVGNLIKALRMHDGLKEALADEGVTLIHDSEFQHYKHRRDGRYILEEKSVVLSKNTKRNFGFEFKHNHNVRTKHLVNAFLTGLIPPKTILKRKGGLFGYDGNKELVDKVKYRYNILLPPKSFNSSILDFRLNSSLYVFSTLIIADDGHYELLNSLFCDFKIILS